jgi:hypothetical protein
MTGDSAITNPYPVAADPTAQTESLTTGQRIVTDYERNLIAEPCELAAAIDEALATAWSMGARRMS